MEAKIEKLVMKREMVRKSKGQLGKVAAKWMKGMTRVERSDITMLSFFVSSKINLPLKCSSTHVT